jgi:bacitracin transport system ATP-binding protein
MLLAFVRPIEGKVSVKPFIIGLSKKVIEPVYRCNGLGAGLLFIGGCRMNILEASNIRKSFGNKFNKQEVLKGLDITIREGEFVSIMGASGSGKTTLLNVLSSIDKVSEGSIKIKGKEMTSMKEKQLAEFRKHHLGFIFQDYNLLDTLTVKENILLPLSISKVSRKEAEDRFQVVAKELGIDELKDKYPNEISGGQKQRTSAARAFIHEPSIIFADEPTGALDSKSASDLLNKLSELNQKRTATIMMVTHDPVAASYGSRVIFIKDGQMYTQLYKGEQSRQAFFKDIMKTQGVLGGVQNEH